MDIIQLADCHITLILTHCFRMQRLHLDCRCSVCINLFCFIVWIRLRICWISWNLLCVCWISWLFCRWIYRSFFLWRICRLFLINRGFLCICCLFLYRFCCNLLSHNCLFWFFRLWRNFLNHNCLFWFFRLWRNFLCHSCLFCLCWFCRLCFIRIFIKEQIQF